MFFLPWLDRSPVKSIRYRGGIYKIALALFVVSFFAWCWLGMQPPTPVLTTLRASVQLDLLRLLPADADLHQTRKDQAGTGTG